MPSPFPGMDPYLEGPAEWPDLHLRLIGAIARLLGDVAPDPYYVRLDERVYVSCPVQTDSFDIRPDVTVVGREEGLRADAPVGVVEADTGVQVLRAAIPVEVRDVFLEIRSRASHRVVTVVELLSPSNKISNSHGQRMYLRKRKRIFSSGTGLVEIDLLRTGDRMPMDDPWPDTAYVVLVSRPRRRPLCEVYPIGLRERLPVVEVPLLPEDRDLQLDLQAAMDQCHDEARYERYVPYDEPPEVTLGPEDQAWARGRLEAAKRA